MKPGKYARNIVSMADDLAPNLSNIVKYFGYGFYNNNGLRDLLKKFNLQT